MGAYLDSPFRRCCPLLFQLVAAQPARTVNGTHRLLYTHSCRRLSLPACRRCMDLPPSQTGPYGRCVQQRERKFHAGNKAYRKRIFCKSADTVLLWQEVEQRLDQCRESFPCLHRTGNARFGKVFCSGKFLYQAADRERLCRLYLRFQVSRPLHHCLQSPAQPFGGVQSAAEVLCHQLRRSLTQPPLQSHQPEILGGHIRRLRIGLHHTPESEQDLDSETG